MSHRHLTSFTEGCATLIVASILGPVAPISADDSIEGAKSPHSSTTQPVNSTQPTTEPTMQPIPGRLVVTTWAPKGFRINPTALSFDRAGRCYVAQTRRREGGEMEVRPDPNHRVTPDHTFRTVEDRFRFGGDGDPAWGLQTGGKKEIITRLEDSKGTGKADKADIFYEGFNQNGNDILAGVLWNEGDVYATLAPNLWRLRDAKHAGHADEVRSLSFGYGVHMSFGGHNMHGLTVGPDGKIYFTIGDKGLNVTTAEGRQLNYPYCGACLRCNPDGSDLEVFAFGLRNPFEIAFDKYGNLFSVDNDGDLPTERERLVYITEGSDSGWRFNWQYRNKRYDVTAPPEEAKERYNPWMREKMSVPYFPGQPAYITPGLASYTDGPCGFKYASEGCLNERYRGAFFIVEFPKATIRAFRVKPKGAYFTLDQDEIVSKGVQCTGLAFGNDGALYGAEWGKTAFKLGNTGSVIKLDDPTVADGPLRRETQKLLSEGPYKRSIDELVKRLNHQDMRVRLDAQFELVRRNQQTVLLNIATTANQPQMARIHALWGMGQYISTGNEARHGGWEFAQGLKANCLDPDPEIRAQSLKLIGEMVAKWGAFAKLSPVTFSLDNMLFDPSLRVRYFAAAAIGKMQDHAAISALFKLAAENHPIDPYIRHAIVMGLTGIGDRKALAAAAKNPSPDVRLVAVVALRRLAGPAVAAFRNDREELVVTEAARAIHDDYSIPAALPALAAAADRYDITNEAFVRRALNANLRVGGGEQVSRLVRYAVNESNPSAMRVEALDILANWDKPVVNDRVEGWYRTWPTRSGFAVKAALNIELAGLLASRDHDVALAATQLIDRLKLKTDDAVFVGWVADISRPVNSRVTALRLLASRKYPELAQSLDVALASSEPLLRIAAVRVLSETEPARAMKLISAALVDGSILEKQSAFRLLGELRGTEANAELSTWMDKFLAGQVQADLQLDLLEAAEATRNKDLRKKIRQWEQSLPATDGLAHLSPVLAGGDAERGKSIFNGHADASCIRCHSTTTDGTGSTVGPNLSAISSKPDKPRRYLLESLIDPNAYIVPGYGMSSFKLKDGSEVAAEVKSESADAVQLVDLEGKTTTLKKSDIASRTPAVSMMPAMGAILTRDEIRDVIEYLSTLKK